jgi:hypothetical protein
MVAGGGLFSVMRSLELNQWCSPAMIAPTATGWRQRQDHSIASHTAATNLMT